MNVIDKGEKLVIHPEDARKLALEDNQRVKVVSRRGELEVQARFSHSCKQGVVSMSFHFSETPTNMLTCSEVDPVAKTPTTKVCAVRLEPL